MGTVKPGRERHRWIVLGGRVVLTFALAVGAIECMSAPPPQTAKEAPPAPALSEPARLVPGHIRELVDKLELPAAFNVLDLKDAPNVIVSNDGIYVEDQLAADEEWVSNLDGLKRVDDLFTALKHRRESWKSEHSGEEFRGEVNLWIDADAPVGLVKSAFQTTAFAGYPNPSFIVRDAGNPDRLGRLPADAIVPGPPGTDATVTSGRLPPEVIQRVVRQNYAKLRACYTEALDRNPSLEGRVAVRFVIGRDGSVAKAESIPESTDSVPGVELPPGAIQQGTALPDPVAIQCMVDVFRGLEFPEPDGGILTVVYPVMFSPE